MFGNYSDSSMGSDDSSSSFDTKPKQQDPVISKAPIFVKASAPPPPQKTDPNAPVEQNPFGVDENADEFQAPKKEDKADLNENQLKKKYGTGFNLLAKMGFKAGSGLGKNEDGRLNPVQATIRKAKAGLSDIEPEKMTVDDIETEIHKGVGTDMGDELFASVPNEGWVRGKRSQRVVYKSKDNLLKEMAEIFDQQADGGRQSSMKIIDMTTASGPRVTTTQTMGSGVIEDIDLKLKEGTGDMQLLFCVESALQSLESFLQSAYRAKADERNKHQAMINEKQRIENKKLDIIDKQERIEALVADISKLLQKHRKIIGYVGFLNQNYQNLKFQSLEPDPINDIPSIAIARCFDDVRRLEQINQKAFHEQEGGVLAASILTSIIENMSDDDFVAMDVKNEILKWEGFVGDKLWERILIRTLLPKFKGLLDKIQVDDEEPDYTNVITLRHWLPDGIPIPHAAELLTTTLLPRCVNYLETWLVSAPPAEQVLLWYRNLRSYLPSEVIEDCEQGRIVMCKALSQIRRRYEPIGY